jgi:hypothetical protein
MSSENGKSGIPSNEEVINELTKDLKNSAIKTDSCGDNDVSHVSELDSEAEIPLNEENEIRDEDYINDKLLKERDEKLSEEEKRVGLL